MMSFFDDLNNVCKPPVTPSVSMPEISRDSIPTRSEIYHVTYKFSPTETQYLGKSTIDFKRHVKDRMVCEIDEALNLFKRDILNRTFVKSAEFDVKYTFEEKGGDNLDLSAFVQLKSLNGLLINPQMERVEIAMLGEIK